MKSLVEQIFEMREMGLDTSAIHAQLEESGVSKNETTRALKESDDLHLKAVRAMAGKRKKRLALQTAILFIVLFFLVVIGFYLGLVLLLFIWGTLVAFGLFKPKQDRNSIFHRYKNK